MKRKKRKINNFTYIFFIIVFITGCSGTLIGHDNLESLYKKNIRDRDVSIYYNISDGYIVAAVKNVGNTFMTNLNMSLECEYNNGSIVTDIQSLNNLKTYFYKNVVFQIDYNECKKLILKYIYYPEEDGGFMNADRFGSYYIPTRNDDIPVENILIIK